MSDTPPTLTLMSILEFEEQWGAYSPAKGEAIIREFGYGPARYYQTLGRIIDTAEAEAEHPVLVHRLRRLRDHRQHVRAQRVAR